MKMSDYSIIEMSELLDLSQSAIRKYESDYNLRIKRNELGNRTYSEEDLEIYRKIKELKIQGHNIHTIRRILLKQPDAIVHVKNSLDHISVNDLSGAELNMILKKNMDEALATAHQKYVSELAAMREYLKEDLREEIKKELQLHADQQQVENQKLLDYLQKMRETKTNQGFFKKWFRK